LAGLVGLEGLVRLAGFVLVSFCIILMSSLSDLGVTLVSFWCHFGVLGCLLATLGLPGPEEARWKK